LILLDVQINLANPKALVYRLVDSTVPLTPLTKDRHRCTTGLAAILNSMIVMPSSVTLPLPPYHPGSNEYPGVAEPTNSTATGVTVSPYVDDELPAAYV